LNICRDTATSRCDSLRLARRRADAVLLLGAPPEGGNLREPQGLRRSDDAGLLLEPPLVDLLIRTNSPLLRAIPTRLSFWGAGTAREAGPHEPRLLGHWAPLVFGVLALPLGKAPGASRNDIGYVEVAGMMRTSRKSERREQVRSVADLVHHGVLARLATPANLRLGRKIVDQDGVELAPFGPLRASAKVGGVAAAQRQRVELASSAAGLIWSRSCTSRKDLFCEHCVATALVLREKVAFTARPPQPRPM
jgi:hypothetical protein